MTQFPIQTDRIHRAIIVMMMGWCVLLMMPAALCSLGYSSISQPIYKLLAAICHQRPERSLYLVGFKLGVCARCTAIYLGFTGISLLMLSGAGGRLLRVVLRYAGENARVVLVVAVAPMLLDVLLNDLGIRESSILSRLITGGIFGVLSAPVLIPSLVGALCEILPAFFHRLGYAQKTQ